VCIGLAVCVWLAGALTGAPGASVAGEGRLAKVFTDHMVLQRGKPVAVWGFGEPGEKVTAAFAGAQVQAVAGAAAGGRWTCPRWRRAPKAGR
jgi:sialate O-acetylesterase